MLKHKEFGFRAWEAAGDPGQKKAFNRLKLSAYLGLHYLNKEARRASWLLMLGIDAESPEMAAHREIYSMFLNEKAQPKTR